MRPISLRRLALLLSALLLFSTTPSFSAPKKPTQAQIDEAKRIEAEKKKAADAAAKKLAQANLTLKQLISVADAARRKYEAAKAELARATREADAAAAAQKRKKLSQLEQATFGGSAGTSQGALARERQGSF